MLTLTTTMSANVPAPQTAMRTSNPPLTAKLPQLNQNQSRLMRLPPELRLVILRELLVSDNAVESTFALKTNEQHPEYNELEIDSFWNSHMPRNRYGAMWKGRARRNKFRFHTRILRTCQKLMHEGWSLMYAENTLAIHIARHWFCEYCADHDPHSHQMCTIVSAYNDACILKHQHHRHSYCVDGYVPPEKFTSYKFPLYDYRRDYSGEYNDQDRKAVAHLNDAARVFASRFRKYEIIIIDTGRTTEDIREAMTTIIFHHCLTRKNS